MWQVLLYTVGGFALIFIDLVLLPGAVLAVAGSGMILYSIVLTYQTFGVFPAIIHLCVVLAMVPKLVTWGLGRVALKDEMKKEDGYMGVPDQAAYIGMKGKSLSDLRPSGTVGIVIEDEEIRLDCIAESGYIEEGHPVVITEQRGPALVVRLAD
ncbi:MAG: hypothetical protein KDC35_14780 [Acidobacteria bacterium]|nr:hypothetical protein [Acidobacteriota bacterium]